METMSRPFLILNASLCVHVIVLSLKRRLCFKAMFLTCAYGGLIFWWWFMVIWMLS